ncbi:MAG: endopeptidase La [Bdellovibrionaceae bacterium]|nr:endopeptidase La [Pseudobdellovibrionaceae bacterium]
MKNTNVEISLAILPVRDLVVFPYMIIPLYVMRPKSIQAISHALSTNRELFITAQKDKNIENPGLADLFSVGSIVNILRMRKLSDGRIKILVQGKSRAKIISDNAHADFLQANISVLDIALETPPFSKKTETAVAQIKKDLLFLNSYKKLLNPEILNILDDISNIHHFCDLIANSLGLKLQSAQKLLEQNKAEKKLDFIKEILATEITILQSDTSQQSSQSIPLNNSVNYSNFTEQESNPQSEEICELQNQINKIDFPTKTKKEVEKQLKRLSTIHPESSEFSILRNYLDTIIELPWNINSKSVIDLKKAEKILNSEHYGLEKVKDHIIEFLAVNKLKASNLNQSILCLVGPPGVGKTSLGKSIAKAMNRKYHRIALGGLKDESELRGHRRTYVGAMPGKIIQAFQQVKSNNPVIVLDEIDKLGADGKGDPSAAMLEILDPEQNAYFKDHYLNVEFNLSKTIFIATANNLASIPSALRDRLDIIQLSGYTREEKLLIAEQYLVKKQLEQTGLTSENIQFAQSSIIQMIEAYTREAGVRGLSRIILKVCQKTARKIVEKTETYSSITQKNLHDFLGVPHFLKENQLQEDAVGVATGLAWTSVGGEILYVEALKKEGKGHLQLTGQLGDVMKESAQAAFSYAKAHYRALEIPPKWFDNYDIHLHLPAGGIPKDGPSAGITMAVTLISVMSSKPISKELAMTGELTLTGRVLPVGGIKEKCIAALAHGLCKIILPLANKKDVEDIPKNLRSQIQFLFVEHLDEVLTLAFNTANLHKTELHHKKIEKQNAA